jgi:hypothetical protein
MRLSLEVEVAQGIGAARAGLVYEDGGFDEPRAELVFNLIKLMVGVAAVEDANRRMAPLDRNCL